MIEFAEENAHDLIEEIIPLTEEHWGEIARNKDVIKLNPNYDTYKTLQDLGMLHIVTARDEGRLIGYAITLITPNLHYSDHLFAVNDILFISKKYRGGRTGYRMFKYMEKCYRERGVSVVHIHSKLAHDFAKLMDHLGYSEIEKVYELRFV
jgi:GNAT superfamily N-acetyltransferase